MPLDTPDWQTDTDRSTDPLFTFNGSATNGISMATKQVNVYEGIDVVFTAAVDSELQFNWDTPTAPFTASWQYIIEVLSGAFLRFRLPNRGQRLSMTTFAADALAHNTQCQIVPTARQAFGFDSGGTWYLVLSSGTIGAGATVTVPFQIPYHGVASFSVLCKSDNWRCELQGRDALGLIPFTTWASMREPNVDSQTCQVNVPPLINQAKLVNHSPASAAYSIGVVPSYQFV